MSMTDILSLEKIEVFHLPQVTTSTICFFRFSMDMEIGHVYDRHTVSRKN